MVRRSLIWLALFGLLVSPRPVSASYSDVEIIAQNNQYVEFVYRPVDFIWSAGQDSLGPYDVVRNPHCSSWDVPGKPQLPVRLLYFGLPPAADFDYTIVDERWSSRSEVRFPPYTRPAGQPAVTPLSAVDQALVYRETAQYPASFIQRRPVGRLRSQQVGGLAIFPLVYQPRERRVEILESITIRIRFFGGEAVGSLVAEGRFDNLFSQMLLNAESSRGLRHRGGIKTGLARQADENPFAAAFAWYALRLDSTAGDGIVRISYAVADSLGLDPAGITDPRQIRIFYGGGKQLPVSNLDPLPEFREVALYTVGFADGSWDQTDYLEFYGEALRRWEIDPRTGAFRNLRHHFQRSNVYWFTPAAELASAPLRMTRQDASPTNPTAAQVFDVEAWVHHEVDSVFRIRSDGYVADYYTWYWRTAVEQSLSTFSALDAVEGLPARVYLYTYSFGNPPELQSSSVQPELVYRSRSDDTSVFSLTTFRRGMDLTLQFPQDKSTSTYLDGYDLQYRRLLKLRQGRLKFAAPDTTATITMNVTETGALLPVVWEVTDPFHPVVYTGLELDGSVVRFQTDLVAGERRVFYVAEAGQVSRPQKAERRSPAPLRSPNNRADYLAIGPRLFVEAAADYLQTREQLSGLVTARISIQDVYDNFAYGLVDPLAIRRFLKYAFENWPAPAPQYVLLVGDGHYDLAGNKSPTQESFVPPYLAADEPFPADENFIYFGPDKLLSSDPAGSIDFYPDMIIGRWPVKNTEQVRTIAEKVTRYQSPATFGAWRNRLALVADDETEGTCAYIAPNEIHILGAEYLSHSIIPSTYEQRKIYLTEYPFGSTCRSKPTAHEAILDLINEGVVLIDYLGHGNPDLWAHEHVLERGPDIPKMRNRDRLTVMYTASCSNGFFDHPVNEGLAEAIVRAPDGGAVAAISATRLVFADANLSLNSLFFSLLLEGQVPVLGDALYLAKFLRQFEVSRNCPNPPCERSNDRRYVLLGDPAMRFGAPLHRLVIDQVEPDTLPALGEVTVSGRVVDLDGKMLHGFSGAAEFLVSDALRSRHYQLTDNFGINYQLPGGTIYRGTIPVTAGEFNFKFIVPKDITYGGTSAKIVGYASSADEDAAGGRGNLHLGGTVEVADTLGPTIELYYGETPLSAGVVVTAGMQLSAVLEDASGINLTGLPGHGITVEFGREQDAPRNITAAFSYDLSSARRGRAEFLVPEGQPAGPLEISVKAWDNANNSARLTLQVTIGAAGDFEILEFLNYPNPFSSRTTFYYRTNGVTSRASIEIYTLGGRLIKNIARVEDGTTEWDGTDNLGERVANGVYLTKLRIAGHSMESVGNPADKIAQRVQKVVLWR